MYAYISKAFKEPTSDLVCIIPRTLTLHVCNHATKLAPGWGQRSISRMIMIKYLVKVLRCLYYLNGLRSLCDIWYAPSLKLGLLIYAAMSLDIAQGGVRGQYIG